jgi:glutathione synthase/RimK-type ligase-like ATP-grasp enzyme
VTVIIGSPGDPRVQIFQNALVAQGHPPAAVIPYPDLIDERIHPASLVKPGAWVRIESPGKDDQANHALLTLGADQPDEDSEYARVTGSIPTDKGRILASRQWYLGFRAALRMISDQLRECPPHLLMNHPDEIALMFDKRACHALLQSRGITVPPALPPIHSFDELEAVMRDTRLRRVFVKLAHGSSASGVVAYQTDGTRSQATAAVEMVRENGETKLYNTRQIQTYRSYSDIARLIDALCAQRVHVEEWIPKAYMQGKAFDLRVVVIGGQAAHTVARLSHSPMTNLHLLNERRDRETVRAFLGDEEFEAAMAMCENAMNACFPRSLYAGIDLLIASGSHQPYILEMNAFGDLLKDSHFEDMDTYALEIQRMSAHESLGT